MAKLLGFLKLFRKDLLIMLMAMRHPGTPKAIKGVMLAALLYLISPVDLIPDTIPFFGLMDDAVVLPAAVLRPGCSCLPSQVRGTARSGPGSWNGGCPICCWPRPSWCCCGCCCSSGHCIR